MTIVGVTAMHSLKLRKAANEPAPIKDRATP